MYKLNISVHELKEFRDQLWFLTNEDLGEISILNFEFQILNWKVSKRRQVLGCGDFCYSVLENSKCKFL